MYHTLLRLIPGWGVAASRNYTACTLPSASLPCSATLPGPAQIQIQTQKYEYKYMICTLATNASLSCFLSFPMPSSTTYLCTSPSNLQPPVHIVHIGAHCGHGAHGAHLSCVLAGGDERSQMQLARRSPSRVGFINHIQCVSRI